MNDRFDAGNSTAGYRKVQAVYMQLPEGRSMYILGYDIHAGETVRVSNTDITAPKEPGLYMLADVASENNVHLHYKFIKYFEGAAE